MRTTKEERADLRARCRAGVIAITTDAALVAALIDDVEELEAAAEFGARRWAIAAAEVSKLRAELAEAIEDRKAARDDAARAAAMLAGRTMERDARPEITAAGMRELFAHLYPDEGDRAKLPHGTWSTEAAETWFVLRAHARKVVRDA